MATIWTQIYLLARGNDHRRSFQAESFRDTKANSLRGRGDDRHLANESSWSVSHRSSSLVDLRSPSKLPQDWKFTTLHPSNRSNEAKTSKNDFCMKLHEENWDQNFYIEKKVMRMCVTRARTRWRWRWLWRPNQGTFFESPNGALWLASSFCAI